MTSMKQKIDEAKKRFDCSPQLLLFEHALQHNVAAGGLLTGGLVQKQHIRLLQQQPAQRHATPLSSRQRFDVLQPQ